MGYDIIFIIIGFIFLVFGANILVKGSSNIAKKFHIPEILIGLTIVCIGTSLPELIVTITSAIKGHTDLIVGNAIGSNICNLLLILGFISILKPTLIEKNIKKIHLPVAVLSTVIVMLMSYGIIGKKNIISRWEGIVLIIIFIIYFSIPIIIEIKDIIKSNKENKNKPSDEKRISIFTSIVYILFGIVLLKFGGDFVVNSSTNIAEYFNISQRIIGLTIVAIGTALPELITSIIAIIKKDSDLAVGNLVGSCMLNLWFILGIGAVISPLTISTEFNNNLILLLISNILIFSFCFIGKKNTITRFKGSILFIMFVLYMISLFI